MCERVMDSIFSSLDNVYIVRAFAITFVHLALALLYSRQLFENPKCEEKKNTKSYLVESHGQSAGDGETLTILEAALDGREVADGQVQRLGRCIIAPRPQIFMRGGRLFVLDHRRRR